MKISKQAQREARQLFRSCLVNGVLDEAARAAGGEPARSTKNRAATWPSCRGCTGWCNWISPNAPVRVENAVATTPVQMASIQASLEKRYGPGLEIQYSINPALIGGLRIQVGSDLYDGSVKTRLEKLQQSF